MSLREFLDEREMTPEDEKYQQGKTAKCNKALVHRGLHLAFLVAFQSFPSSVGRFWSCTSA